MEHHGNHMAFGGFQEVSWSSIALPWDICEDVSWKLNGFHGVRTSKSEISTRIIHIKTSLTLCVGEYTG